MKRHSKYCSPSVFLAALDLLLVIICFFLLDRPLSPHSMLIFGWCNYNPRTEVIGMIDSVPLSCYIFYVIPPAFSACNSYPTAPYIVPLISYSPSTSSTIRSHAPDRLIPSCSHNIQATQAPGLCTIFSQRSIIGSVTMYCANMF